METTFFAVAHHGTAGLGNSFGYAEVVQDEDAPRHDQTTTVWGPYNTKERAEAEVARMEALCYKFMLEHDIAQYNYELAQINVLIKNLNQRIEYLRNTFPDEDLSDLFRELAFEQSVVDHINRKIERVQAKIRAI